MVRSWYLNVAAGLLALVGLTALFVGSAGDSWAAPNLVVNGDFETDTSDWTDGTDGTIAHDPAQDADLDAPGAALVTYTGTGAGTGEVTGACIDISSTGDGSYPMQFYYREPSGQTNPGVSIEVVRWENANCTGASTTVSSGIVDPNSSGWQIFNGSVIIASGELGIQLHLSVNGLDDGDQGYFDKISLAFGALDTPTPSTTPTATNTGVATNTPIPTNTPVPTDTAEPTNTPTRTNTPAPTQTPLSNSDLFGTATTASNPAPAAAVEETVIDDSIDSINAQFGSGEQPEGGAAAGGEQPEGSEFPESGYGPNSYQNGGSHTADVIAAAAFAMAVAMLAAGFYLRRRVEQEQDL